MKGKLIQEKEITKVEFEHGGTSYYFDIHPSINNKLVDLKRSNKSFTIGIKSSYFDEELSLNITIPPNITFLSEKDFEERNEDSYFVMNENFEFYHSDGELTEQEVSLGTKVHMKEKKVIIPPPSIPASSIVSRTTTSIPWRKIITGATVILLLALSTLLYKQCSSTTQDTEHILKFLAEYHNDTDLGNKQALLSKMQFPIASYYKLGELTEAEYTGFIDKYYNNSIDSSKTTLDIAKIKSNSEVISHGDSNPPVMSDYINVVNAEYPINYVFFKDGKRSEFDITLGVTLLEDKDGNLKIYEIEELERNEVIVSEPPSPVPPGDTTEGGPESPEPISDGSTGTGKEGGTQHFDCDSLKLNYGDSCDDKDPNTFGDTVNGKCDCIGTQKKPTLIPYFPDFDNDDLGDESGKEFYVEGKQPKNYIETPNDLCPQRHGKGSVNGCPSIEILTVELTYGEPIEIQTTDFDLLAGDKVKWTSTDLKFTSTDIIDPLVESKKYGKVSVSVEIDGVENQKFTDSQILCSKISKNQLERLLDPVIKRGQFDPQNYIPPSVENLADAKRTEIIEILGSNCKVKKSNIVTGLEIGDFIDSNLMTKGSYVVAAKVKSLKYDLKTCTVTSINVDLQK